jgi:hypothetical protein
LQSQRLCQLKKHVPETPTTPKLREYWTMGHTFAIYAVDKPMPIFYAYGFNAEIVGHKVGRIVVNC